MSIIGKMKMNNPPELTINIGIKKMCISVNFPFCKKDIVISQDGDIKVYRKNEED